MPEYKAKPDTCIGCPAYSSGKSFVPGTGNPDALVAYVGQGLGELEAIQGLPFVGDAGIKLDDWNYAADVNRKDIWLTNIVQCWLTKKSKAGRTINRDATDDEIAFCMEAHVKPELLKLNNLKVIIPVGIPAMEVFLGQNSNERDAGSQVRYRDRESAIRSARIVRRKKSRKNRQADLVPKLPNVGCIRINPSPGVSPDVVRDLIGIAIEKGVHLEGRG